MNRSQQFVLHSVDPVTATALSEVRIHIRDVQKLASILDVAGDDDLLMGEYSLSKTQVLKIGALCEPPFVPDQTLTVLCHWHSIRELPYLVHTNFELPLMLEGRKPLAFFRDQRSWLDEYLAPFEPYVAKGIIVRQAIDDPIDSGEHKLETGSDRFSTVYFALPSESWRIEAHKLLMAVSARSGWNESLERFEGSLLGYEDWQNDYWIEFRYRKSSEGRTTSNSGSPGGLNQPFDTSS